MIPFDLLQTSQTAGEGSLSKPEEAAPHGPRSDTDESFSAVFDAPGEEDLAPDITSGDTGADVEGKMVAELTAGLATDAPPPPASDDAAQPPVPQASETQMPAPQAPPTQGMQPEGMETAEPERAAEVQGTVPNEMPAPLAAPQAPTLPSEEPLQPGKTAALVTPQPAAAPSLEGASAPAEAAVATSLSRNTDPNPRTVPQPQGTAPDAPSGTSAQAQTAAQTGIAAATAPQQLGGPPSETQPTPEEPSISQTPQSERATIDPQAKTTEAPRAPAMQLPPALQAAIAEAIPAGDGAPEGADLNLREDLRTAILDARQQTAPSQRIAHVVPHVADQMVVRLTNQGADVAGQEIEIRLDPPELGRVRIGFTGLDGQLAGLVTAERPEVEAMLRRNADALERALSEAGFDSVSLSFGSTGDQQNHSGRQSTPTAIYSGEGGPELGPVLSPEVRPTAGAGNLDIRL